MTIYLQQWLILGVFSLFNGLLLWWKGASIQAAILILKGAKQIIWVVPFLVLGYHLIYFVIQSTLDFFRFGPTFMSRWRYGVSDLKKDVLRAALVSSVLVFLVLFQVTTKSLYASFLMIPNSVDWLLSTFDRVLTGPSLWWWGSHLCSKSIWQGLIVFLDRFYMPWFAYQWLLVIYIMLHDNRSHREYFISLFVLLWVFGTTLAGICQSGGPFFYSLAAWNVYHMNALSEINRIIPLYALNTQAYLWMNYFEVRGPLLAGGISAFPSLHIAMSIYVVLYAQSCRAMIWAAWAGLVLTWLGAILLGWHYIVDGFGAAFTVYCAHKVASALHKF